MIQVLVVEDSAVVRGLLVRILDAAPGIKVLGTAGDGAEAMAFLEKHTPDVITMDIHMPRMDGLEATRRIMETRPVPIVIVSASWNPGEGTTTFRALEAGAVALVEKPRGVGHSDHAEMAAKLVQTVRAMAEVKVVKRWPRARAASPVATLPPAPNGRPASPGCRLVAVGVSTGGPPTLHTLLAHLSHSFPVPLLIVQHIADGFVEGLAAWLGQVTGWPVHVAAQGQTLQGGHAYLAPSGAHTGLDRSGRVRLSHDAPENGLRPAASYLFRSVAEVHGEHAIGVLLTGMGKDGAVELKLMRDRGAVTFAQDQASSVVHGMPGEAIRLGAAVYTLPPEKIAAMLTSLVKRP